ncbi:MAG: hypothetical protein H7831_16475, partial [Magnetococcus sp. WYHC-3]
PPPPDPMPAPPTVAAARPVASPGRGGASGSGDLDVTARGESAREILLASLVDRKRFPNPRDPR